MALSLNLVWFFFVFLTVLHRQNREIPHNSDIYKFFSLSFSFISHINATIYLHYVKINMSVQEAWTFFHTRNSLYISLSCLLIQAARPLADLSSFNVFTSEHQEKEFKDIRLHSHRELTHAFQSVFVFTLL